MKDVVDLNMVDEHLLADRMPRKTTWRVSTFLVGNLLPLPSLYMDIYIGAVTNSRLGM